MTPNANFGIDISGEDLYPVEIVEKKERKTSTWMATWSVTNIVLGLGIMGTPYACVGNSWFTIPVLLGVAALCCFTGELLGECLYTKIPKGDPRYVDDTDNPRANWKQTKFSFAEIAKDVWPTIGPHLATAATMLELFGGIVLYIIVMGNSMTPIFNTLTHSNWPQTHYTIIFTLLSFPFVLTSNMKIISTFSTIAVVGLMVSIATTIVYCIVEMIYKKTSFNGLPAINLMEMPLGLSIIVFSYCGHGFMLHIQRSMKYPESFNRILRISFGFSAIVKLFFGLVPAILFHRNIQQMVINNLQSRPLFQHFALFTIAVSALFSLPLATHIVCDSVYKMALEYLDPKQYDMKIAGRKPKAVILFFTARLFVIAVGVVIGTTVPQFALIMGLIGSITGSCLCFIFPPLFHIKIFRTQLSKAQIVVRYLIVAFGMFVLISGFASSSYELYCTYK